MPWLEPYEWEPPVYGPTSQASAPVLIWTGPTELAIFWCNTPALGEHLLHRQNLTVDGTTMLSLGEEDPVAFASGGSAAVSIYDVILAADGSLLCFINFESGA